MPSVERLFVDGLCEVENFEAALDAGMATVLRLTVQLSEYDVDSTTMKLKSLTRMIRGAGKLNSLTIYAYDSKHFSPPRQLLFQALEACPTVTEIHVNMVPHWNNFTEPEVKQLRRITARNTELEIFLANPITYPKDKLLTLMRQFNNCPSGLFMLARRLPERFSFEKGNTLFPSTEPNHLTRKLRKRRKISYKE